MWPKEEEVEGVVEGEAEAGPGVAAVVVLAHLGAEVVAVEVAGGEDTRGVVGAEGEAEEVEEEGACKLLGANNPCGENNGNRERRGNACDAAGPPTHLPSNRKSGALTSCT